MTRIQKERFESEEEYNRVRGHFVVTPQLMTLGKVESNRVLKVFPPISGKCTSTC